MQQTALGGNNKSEETVSFWVKPSTVSGVQNLISQGDGLGSSGDYTTIELNGTGVRVGLWTGSSYQYFSATSVASPNKWLHVVYAHSNASSFASLYINGAFIASGSTYQDTSANHSALFIGKDPNQSTPFSGTIDDVRIYNRALSAQEVAQLYATGR